MKTNGRGRVLNLVTQLEHGGAQTLAGWLEHSLESQFSIETRFLYFKSDVLSWSNPICLSTTRPSNLIEFWRLLLALYGSTKDKSVIIAHTHYSILLTSILKITRLYRGKIIAVNHSEERIYPVAVAVALRIFRSLKIINNNVFVAKHIVWGKTPIYIPNPMIKSVARLPADQTPAKDLLFVGRISPEKQLKTLLDAMPHLPARSLAVIGSGLLSKDLVTYSKKLGVSDRVEFLGARSHTEVLAMMSNCNLLIIPSESEAMPMVLLEGVSQGAKIVASSIKAHEFAFESGNVKGFKVNDSYDLAKVINNFNFDADGGQRTVSVSNQDWTKAFKEETILAQWVELLDESVMKNV